MENKLSVESQIYFLNQIKQLKNESDDLIEKRRHLLETVRQSKEFLELANANTEKSLTLLKEENIDIMGENTRSKK